jgi:hypothetical protein
MLHKLINHSSDIRKLVDEGYELQVDGAFLLAHHIPYVNSAGQVKYGSIVTALTLAGPDRTGKPSNHTVHFCGEKPCDSKGQPLNAIINSSRRQQLSPSIIVDHYFSSKPVGGFYADYYDKIRTYAEILGSQARAIDPDATARPFRISKENPEDNIFNYPDTNSARAGIDALNVKFQNQRIAIIGLGGTGSYILDLVAKTPVREIHIYDGDAFQVHNAFRAPGAVEAGKFNAEDRLMKTDYYNEIYSKMHKGLISHPIYLTADNIDTVQNVDFAFICVDSNMVRQLLINHFLRSHIPFIDVGLGIHLLDDSLIGTLRVTTANNKSSGHLTNRIGGEEHDLNEYAQNIQIADLNCLNGALAVIKWKKILGFYQDLKHEQNTLYLLNTGKLINDDIAI